MAPDREYRFAVHTCRDTNLKKKKQPQKKKQKQSLTWVNIGQSFLCKSTA